MIIKKKLIKIFILLFINENLNIFNIYLIYIIIMKIRAKLFYIRTNNILNIRLKYKTKNNDNNNVLFFIKYNYIIS